MYFVNSYASFESLIDAEKSFVIAYTKSVSYAIVRHLHKLFAVYGIVRNFSTTNGLHNSLFKRRSDSHNFARSFHLSSESSFCIYEFIKRPFGEFYNNIVECRLKAGICRACNGVLYFAEVIADCNFSRNLCYGIACSL